MEGYSRRSRMEEVVSAKGPRQTGGIRMGGDKGKKEDNDYQKVKPRGVPTWSGRGAGMIVGRVLGDEVEEEEAAFEPRLW